MISVFRVPKVIDKNVKKILVKINSEFLEEYVPIKVEDYAANSHCYNNVAEKIKRDGGYIHYGWSIYQTDYLTEAEHHAVWESPDGDLIDITPNTIENLDEILFVSDNVFKGTDNDNIRINNTDLIVIDDLFKLFEIKSKLYNDFGTRIDEFKINIPIDVNNKINDIIGLINEYQNYIEMIQGKFSKCICGGDKTYQNCHSKTTIFELEYNIKQFLENRKP